LDAEDTHILPSPALLSVVQFWNYVCCSSFCILKVEKKKT